MSLADSAEFTALGIECINIKSDTPLRHLDLKIALAVGWVLHGSTKTENRWNNFGLLKDHASTSEFPPAYTTSKDAACKLLCLLDGNYAYHVVKKTVTSYAASVDVSDSFRGSAYSVGADGPTEEAALVAAILFAIASAKEHRKDTEVV